MRKLKYGVFYYSRPVSYGDDWDMLPIGAHAAMLRRDRENARTRDHEYYYEANNNMHIVRNATLLEKGLCKAKYILKLNRFGGYIEESIIDQDKKTYYEEKAKERKQKLIEKGRKKLQKSTEKGLKKFQNNKEREL